MEKLLFLFIIIVPFMAFADGKKTPQELFTEVEKEWVLDANGNVSFTKVIEIDGISKEDLYIRALSYFTYNYNSANDVIQTKDKDQGIIIGKGIYPNVFFKGGFTSISTNVVHLVRVDVKDSRARVVITISQYNMEVSGGTSPTIYPKFRVNERFPFVKKDAQKTLMCHVIYNTVQRVNESFKTVEKSLKEGNTTSKENDEW